MMVANPPGVRIEIKVNPFAPVDDAEHLAAESSLTVWLPSTWPADCGVPVFGIVESDIRGRCWVARTADMRASRTLVIMGLRPQPQAQRHTGASSNNVSSIKGLAGEAFLRQIRGVDNGVPTVAYNLAVHLPDVMLVLSGRELSAEDLTVVGDTLSRVSPASET